MNLKRLRKNIDTVDKKILTLLNERIKNVIQIKKLKKKEKSIFYFPSREKNIIERLLKENRGPLPARGLKEIFGQILHVSRSLQKKPEVAYLGPEATFTHLAAIKNFGKDAKFISVKTISDVFNEVEKEKASYGVVPVESSTEGIVSYTLDNFIDSDLKISSEILLGVSHNLLSKAGSLKKIKKIYSHPQAIAQSRNWIEENIPNATIVEVSSTARAAQLAKKEKKAGAIASSLACELYGLKNLAPRIENEIGNFTRFLVIGKNYVSKCGKDKTSILFSIKDRVGALHDMLVPFKKNRINLTKIESRPSKRKAWEYVFFIDFLGHYNDASAKKALKQLERQCIFLKILGSYPMSD